MFSADAWYNVTYISGEVINPKRNVPLSLFFGTLIVSVIYLLTNFVYIKILPLSGSPDGADVLSRGIQFATDDRVATSAMSVVFGDYAAIIMAIFIMISTFGCNHGLIMAGPRVYYAMAKDGLFFRKVGEINKNGVPGFAIVVQGVWSVLLCLSGTYGNLLDYVIFAVLIFFTLTILAIFVLRVKRPDIPRPYKAFGYPVIPAIYILTTVTIMVILLIYKPDYTFPGLGIVVLGIPVFYLWRKYNKSPEKDEVNGNNPDSSICTFTANLNCLKMFPEKFIQRIKSQKYIDAEALLKALEEPSPVSIRINPSKWNKTPLNAEPVPWCKNGYYLGSRPSYTLDPLFHSGCYYPQEASGMFLEQAY